MNLEEQSVLAVKVSVIDGTGDGASWAHTRYLLKGVIILSVTSICLQLNQLPVISCTGDGQTLLDFLLKEFI